MGAREQAGGPVVSAEFEVFGHVQGELYWFLLRSCAFEKILELKLARIYCLCEIRNSRLSSHVPI